MARRKQKNGLSFIQFQISSPLKEEFLDFCERRGVNMSAQVKMWIRDILDGKEVSLHETRRSEDVS